MQLIDAAPLMHFPQPLKLRWHGRVLHFKKTAATSRGALSERRTCIIEANGCGMGECCTMPGLLPDPSPEELDFWCARVEQNQGLEGIAAPSPIQFGLECALQAALSPGRPRWNTPFTRGEEGIPIHHLIWMDSTDAMLAAMQHGIARGFSCLKLKVGALPFKQECGMLREAHAAFPQAEIRVDANGAFTPQEALSKLEMLATSGVSLIEQPIRPGQWQDLAQLCRLSPLPIALDEELIGNAPLPLLDTVQPQAIVIKPSLHGGLLAAQHWAQLAEQRGIRWWVNSALESHTGLTAMAEWCSFATPGTLQGLGTGRLFTDDAPGRIELRDSSLYYIT